MKILLAVVFMAISSASRLDFQANPSNVFPVLTKLLRIRCAVQLDNDEPFALRNLVRSLPTQDNIFMDSFESVSNSSTIRPTTHKPTTHAPTSHGTALAQVDHVVSIIISRYDPATGKSVTVAKISPFDPPTASIDQGYVKVEGSTNKSADGRELGRLEVSWDYPSEAQAGQYACDVYALDYSFHPVSLTVSVRVTTSQVTTPELAGYVAQSQKIIDDLQRSLSTFTSRLTTLEQDGQVQVEVLTNTTNSVQDLKGAVSNLRAQNIQTGSFTCSSNSVSNVQFPKPYSQAPTIFFSFPQIQASYSSWSYIIVPQNVTRAGFSISCSLSYVSLNLQWFSIDN